MYKSHLSPHLLNSTVCPIWSAPSLFAASEAHVPRGQWRPQGERVTTHFSVMCACVAWLLCSFQHVCDSCKSRDFIDRILNLLSSPGTVSRSPPEAAIKKTEIFEPEIIPPIRLHLKLVLVVRRSSHCCWRPAPIPMPWIATGTLRSWSPWKKATTM